ncbi:MAG: ATP-grasp ribosomal peptide maturase [Actinobacteria bacterium]|nr:ATP-grasp ribosomal peptide maturase [Actinomycetota bacterium]MBI3686547.1 ATP-grasp ribosomal peptide maturase [Actinomycetota bacterium]
MGRRVTLVLTHPFDPTADYVVSELNRRGAPVFRCDPGEFPQRLTLTARLDDDRAGAGWVGCLRLPEREVFLSEVGCAYYRRPTIFDLPAGMTEQVRRWSAAEARMGVGGVLSALPHWLNHPAAIAAAEYKPVQLALAGACGLTVPATLVTNDPAEAANFVAHVGRAVYKPLTPAGITEAGTHRVTFTTPIAVSDVDESIRLTAHMIQAWLDKRYEVRLTVADDTFLAARIDAGSDAASVDWRADYDALTYTPIEVPDAIRGGVRGVMARLRLRFGIFDFVVSPDGRWWFLEVNPNGQWAWIEDATGLPIAAAIADALTREET